MTAAYRLTPRAAQGLTRIARYADERFGSAVAVRGVDELEPAFEQGAANPGMGHHREDFAHGADVRFWSVGPTLIAYRARPGWLEILFVERGELDWRDLLRRHLE